MSVIRTHVLLDIGGRQDASRAAAAQVFQLALDGYLKIRPSTTAQAVQLSRTNKPTDDLPAEALYLIEALFTEDRTVILSATKPVRVAQRLVSIALYRLQQDGLAWRVNLWRLSGWLYASSFALAIAWVVMMVALRTGAWVLVGLFPFMLCMWLAMSLSVKHILITRKGRPAVRQVAHLYGECVSAQQEEASEIINLQQLPFRLLWSREPVSGAYLRGFATKPAWWHADWPDNPEQLGSCLRVTFEILAASLDQERAAKKKQGWKIDGELERKIQRRKELYQIISSTNDTIGYSRGSDGNAYEGGGGAGGGDGDGGSDGAGDGSDG